MRIPNESLRQEIIKVFHNLCKDLETINPNDYEEISSTTEVNTQTEKKIRTAYLRKKDV